MINSNIRIGFIGFGNMGQAICDGLIRAEACDPKKISACAGNYDKLLDNTERRGINACDSAAETVDNSDLVVIAVKPRMVRPILEPVKDRLMGKAIVSIAAGCDFDFYEDFLISGSSHISVIPNTPVSVCEGIIACEDRHSLTEEQFRAFRRIFSAIAVLVSVGSAQLPIAGTISGCGPAFAAVFIEALADAGVKYGLGRETACRLASQMIVGTGRLQLETGLYPGALKDAVCSPGGTTIKGIQALEERGFRAAVLGAVDSAQTAD